MATVTFCQDFAMLPAYLKRRANASLRESRRGKLISLFSPKGGAGTTTLAWNLAYELRRLLHEPVVFVDFDQVYCNTALLMENAPSVSLSDLADHSAEEVDDGLLARLVVSHPSGVDMLLASRSILHQAPCLSPELVSRCLAYLRHRYSYVVVDLPSGLLDPCHQAVVEQADDLLLVGDTSLPALFRTRQYIGLAKQEGQHQAMQLLLNRIASQPLPGELPREELEKAYEIPILARIAEDKSALSRAWGLGLSVSQVDGDSPVANSVRQLALKLATLEMPEAEPAEQPRLLEKIPGLLSGLGMLLKGTELHAVSKA